MLHTVVVEIKFQFLTVECLTFEGKKLISSQAT